MPRFPIFAMLVYAPLAAAQATLGALLDAGAKRLSADEFKREIVQRTIVGATLTGTQMEMMYSANGVLAGRAEDRFDRRTAAFSGEWQIDEAARICTSYRAVATTGLAVVLPPRCQYWFKLGKQYFFADSDTDRSVKVQSRTIAR